MSDTRGYETESWLYKGKPVVRFHHRAIGLYSPNGVNGGEIQPWTTRTQCREEARRYGFVPVFCRDGKSERGVPW